MSVWNHCGLTKWQYGALYFLALSSLTAAKQRRDHFTAILVGACGI